MQSFKNHIHHFVVNSASDIKEYAFYLIANSDIKAMNYLFHNGLSKNTRRTIALYTKDGVCDAQKFMDALILPYKCTNTSGPQQTISWNYYENNLQYTKIYTSNINKKTLIFSIDMFDQISMQRNIIMSQIITNIHFYKYFDNNIINKERGGKVVADVNVSIGNMRSLFKFPLRYYDIVFVAENKKILWTFNYSMDSIIEQNVGEYISHNILELYKQHGVSVSVDTKLVCTNVCDIQYTSLITKE